VIPGKQAMELARLREPLQSENIPASAARALVKSIDASHVLEGRVFLWNEKHGVALRLVDLADTDHVRIERTWATSVDDIPAKIEELAQRIFADRKEAPPAPAPPVSAKKKSGEEEEPAIPAKVTALLKKHPDMVYVPGGEFLMGNDNDADADNMAADPSRREGVSRYTLLAAEKPEHTARTKPFLIDKHEVTNAEYKKFRPDHEFPADKADYPATGISWQDAAAYADWAGKRLPTETEWEKAARGTDGRKWPWGNVFEQGRCNLGTGTAPVGSFTGDCSPYGVYDMAGNVQEWTASEFVSYPGNTRSDVAFDSNKKVVRGSYYGGNDFLARCTMRFCALPGTPHKRPEGENYGFIGLRCALGVD
jgi:formylglycine-generating enzyme required for sulfatase activity